MKKAEGKFSDNMRSLVDFINQNKIPREDIVGITPTSEGYFLIYYY